MPPRASKPRIRQSAGNVHQFGAVTVSAADQSMTVDANKATPPENVYTADFGWFEHEDGQALFLFGRIDRDAPDILATRLEIRVPLEQVVTAVWRSAEPYLGKLDSYVRQWRDLQKYSARPDSHRRLAAKQSHVEWANLVLMAHAGTMANFDFHVLAPMDLSAFNNTRNVERLKVGGVVRVQLSSFAAWQVLQDLAGSIEPISAALPPGVFSGSEE